MGYPSSFSSSKEQTNHVSYLLDPKHLRRGLKLPNFTRRETPSFFHSWAPPFLREGEKECLKRPGFDEWDQGLNPAEKALRIFREAERLRQKGDPSSAATNMHKPLRRGIPILKKRCCNAA